jgi:hypothetical protein
MSENETAPGLQPRGRKETVAPLDNQNFGSAQEEIDWQDDSRIILHDQAATAAYIADNGELVIVQRDTLGCAQGTIFIAPESIKLFAQAISRLAACDDDVTNVDDLRIDVSTKGGAS